MCVAFCIVLEFSWSSNDNQVTLAFFHLITDKANGNSVTSLKMIPNFFDAMCSWYADLSSPAAVPGSTYL